MAGGGPTTITGQTDLVAKIITWVQQAWIDIQLMRPNWNFMMEDFTFPTVADQRDYTADDNSITDLALWDTESFLIFLTSTGASEEHFLVYRKYREWREQYRAGMAARDAGYPQIITIMPSTALRLEPKPNAIYTLSGEYKRTAQTLTAESDLPTGLPDNFHPIIVWRALQYYASFEDAPEVADMAETKFDDLLLRLENEELPTMSEAYDTLA